MKNYIIHIGQHEPETSSIQSFLWNNRDILAKFGYLYPMTGLEKNAHKKIANACQTSTEKPDILFKHLHNEIKESDIDKIILSSEDFNKLIVEPKKLKEHLGLGHYKIIFYLQKIDELIQSMYAHSRNSLDTIQEFLEQNLDIYQRYDIIKKWINVFGKDQITIKTDQPTSIDFIKEIGIKNLSGFNFETEQIKNELNPLTYELIRIGNLYSPNEVQKKKLFDLAQELSQNQNIHINKILGNTQLNATLKRKVIKKIKEQDQKIAQTFFNRNELFESEKFDLQTKKYEDIKIAVFLHVYYLDLFDEVYKYLNNFENTNFDLYVNIVNQKNREDQINELVSRIKSNFKNAYVIKSNNIGYDIGGTLLTLKHCDLDHYDLICKIHTKKAPHWHKRWSDAWRTRLIKSLIGSPEIIKQNINYFYNNPNLGILGSETDFFTDMGSNTKYFHDLCDLWNIPLHLRKCDFIGGTMSWARKEIYEVIKDSELKTDQFYIDNPSKDGTMAHAFERAFMNIAPTLKYEVLGVPSTQIKPICFYLPQFHYVEENSRWWGEGYTEWTGVKRTKDNPDINHKIKRPHNDIGYYNIINKETRAQQAEMAKKYGVYGFCYHHYWFNGKKLLEKPLELMLEDGEPNIPFCLNWANENWTRKWDGLASDILMKQTYPTTRDEWKNHINYLIKFFKHPNYIKIKNTPVFLIYRLSEIPNIDMMLSCWKEELNKNNIPDVQIIELMTGFGNKSITKTLAEFQPGHAGALGFVQSTRYNKAYIYNTEHIWNQIETINRKYDVYFRGTHIGFDNSPRVGPTAHIQLGGNPKSFENHLINLFKNIQIEPNKISEDFFFINAWNEWGEGCVLEPNEEDGYAYLEALKNALDKTHATKKHKY